MELGAEPTKRMNERSQSAELGIESHEDGAPDVVQKKLGLITT